MITYKTMSEFEDMLFENEKALAMVECVQALIAEEVGVAKYSLDYTLLKATEILRDNNKFIESMLKKL